MKTRKEIVQNLRKNPNTTVLIVGAGINGTGLFRELALQGIDTLMIDKSDVAAGASSAPSRMIHGGLRYLENREVRLVKESLKERNLLLKNAPHYVKPLPTVIPIFHWFAGLLNAISMFLGFEGKSANRGAILVKIGLSVYDFFTRKQRVMPTNRFMGRAKSLSVRPQLNDRIVCTATYYDAWISHPERLCLELVKDAMEINAGAEFLNYCSLSGIRDDSGWLELRDGLSGEIFTVKPQVVVNATGAWIDFTNAALHKKTNLIGGTKGSHLIIDNKELMEATRGEMLFYENPEGRICILFPLHGKVLVGSTDIKITDPETATCEDGEVDYMLESVHRIFPTIRIDPSQIVYRFSGVRPLPNSSADDPARISRDHSLDIIPPSKNRPFPVYSMIGGKWTTFRAFSTHALHAIGNNLNHEITGTSENVAIGGGKGYPAGERERRAWLAARYNESITQRHLELLLERYGTYADNIITFLYEGIDRPLENHPDYSVREIEYLMLNEFVEHLDDLILRRTSLAIGGELTMDLLRELTGILVHVKKGTEVDLENEFERTKQILYQKHRVKLK